MQSSLRPEKKGINSVIFATGGVLLLLFFVAIILFLGFAAFAPSLTGKCVALVGVDSEITIQNTPPGLFSAGQPGSEEIAGSIRAVGKRPDIGAMVLVVNTPGGSAVGTHEIYSAVKEVNKPKVSYFREVAGSGGYYIAMGTDYIVSDPDAITGSIGVITTAMEMSELFKKVGINVTSIQSGAHKDIGSMYRSMTPEEKAMIQSITNEAYAEFRSIIIKSRGERLDMKKFDEMTDGRIFSGRQAQKAGFVDQVGDKRDAVMKAATMAGIPFEKYEDIKICPVNVADNSQTIFSAESLLSALKESGGWRMEYK